MICSLSKQTLLIIGTLALLLCSCKRTDTHKQLISIRNKMLVEKTCRDWEKGNGSLFDLLAKDVKWTVAGNSPISGVYHGKQQFLDQAVKPITSKLSGAIKPTVQNINAEDDKVILLWNGQAMAKDGQPYNNTYSWHMTFKKDSITKVIALLDTYELDQLMNRVDSITTK